MSHEGLLSFIRSPLGPEKHQARTSDEHIDHVQKVLDLLYDTRVSLNLIKR